MRTRLAAAGVALVALLPFISSAQSNAELQAQLQALIQQISTIEAQLGAQSYVPPSAPTVSLSSSGSSSGCAVIYRTISLGASGSDVTTLQRFLISQGYLASGSSSGYFGELTKAALRSFQARNNIVSSGEAWSSGYGATGPRTRSLIQSLSCAGGSPTPSFTPTPVPVTPGSFGGVPCIAGNTGVASGASITLYDQPTVAGVACRAQTRQCFNGVLTGDPQFRFNTCSVVNAPPERCRLDGETVFNGESRVFYEDESVDFGDSCSSVAQTRTCIDGKLSGSSRYKYSSCKGGAADKCEIDGITLSHNSSRVFFNKKTVPFGETCTLYSQSRTCQDGDLTGSSDYKYATCASAISNNCTLDGATVTNGTSRSFYSSRTVAYGSTCTLQSRLCTKGVLNGSDDFQYAACTVGAAGSCTLDGATVAHNQSRIFYSSTSVGFGGSCSTVALSRKCVNGTFEGNTTFNKANCAVASAGACTYNGTSVAHGGAKKFFKSSSVNFGALCDTTTNAKNKTCTDGAWVGDAAFPSSSCVVGGQSAATCTLTAEPSVVMPNNTIVFNWTSKDATSASLFGASMSSVAKGSYSFAGYSSTGDQAVTLSVSGPGGAGSCSTNVFVQNVLPPTCTLKYRKHASPTPPNVASVAGPAALNYADYLTLDWTSTGATSYASSSSSVGSSGDVTSSVALGAYTSKPRDTSFTYTFKNTGGTKQCSLNVSYNPPTCGTINSDKTTYAFGDPATLTYSSTNADYATATSSDRIPANGSATVKLQGGTNTFNFVFTGLGGQKTCTKTILVSTPLTVTSPGSGTFQKDNSITITWQYTGTAAASTRVYLMLIDGNGTQVGSSLINSGLSPSTSYGWKLPDTLGGTAIASGDYKIRAVAYTSTAACLNTPTTCAVIARADSATISLSTGIAGTVIQNLANALSALESALVRIIGSLGF